MRIQHSCGGMQMYIYKITCKENNKVYIGQTTESIQTRFKRHMGYQKNESDTKFYRAVRKYGCDNFTIELIDTATSRQELDELEVYWIRFYDAINSGYNTALGKRGGDTLSMNPNLESIKQKISKTKLGGNNPNATKIKLINVQTGGEEFFASMIECQRAYNIPRHDIIRRRCLGTIKKPYKGKYMFEYA